MMGEMAVSELECAACKQKKYGKANIRASSIFRILDMPI